MHFIGALKEGDDKAKKNAALLEKVAKSVGSAFDGTKCFLVNYDQEFKPKYDKKVKLEFSLRLPKPITDRKTYGIIGFYQDGATEDDVVNKATIAYTGFQNMMHTIGISIDEEVDAQGLSWYPKEGGKAVERYRINTAITPAAWTADGGTSATLKSTEGDTDAQKLTRETSYIVYMDTFIRRKTVIRNKSITATINELGASFAASMILLAWLFKDVKYNVEEDGSLTSIRTQTLKTFRFRDSKEAWAEFKDTAYSSSKPEFGM